MHYFIGNYYMPDGTKPIRTKLKTPIEWIPLETIGEETLLISKDVLDWEFFGNKKDAKKGWERSYLKDYLNGLYGEWFSGEEKEVILEKEHGKLFVLSEAELCSYFPDAEDRRAVIPMVMDDKGEYEIFLEHSTYWLRNDTSTEYDLVKNVDEFGNIEWRSPESEEIGVRPCIYVNTKKARLLTAKAGFNKWHHFWKLEEF